MIESIYICDRCGKKVKRAFDIKMGLSSPKIYALNAMRN